MVTKTGVGTLNQKVTGLLRVGAIALLGSVSVAACGDSGKSNISRPDTAGKSTGAEGGEGATTNGGSGAASGSGGSGGTTAMVEPCVKGDRSCNGNVPRECNSKGEWVDETECGGVNKVCTGMGVCVPYRLLNAGIDTFGPRPAEQKDIVLKEQTLSAAPKACGKVQGKTYCVTGGVR